MSKGDANRTEGDGTGSSWDSRPSSHDQDL